MKKLTETRILSYYGMINISRKGSVVSYKEICSQINKLYPSVPCNYISNSLIRLVKDGIIERIMVNSRKSNYKFLVTKPEFNQYLIKMFDKSKPLFKDNVATEIIVKPETKVEELESDNSLIQRVEYLENKFVEFAAATVNLMRQISKDLEQYDKNISSIM